VAEFEQLTTGRSPARARRGAYLVAGACRRFVPRRAAARLLRRVGSPGADPHGRALRGRPAGVGGGAGAGRPPASSSGRREPRPCRRPVPRGVVPAPDAAAGGSGTCWGGTGDLPHAREPLPGGTGRLALRRHPEPGRAAAPRTTRFDGHGA
jgi:hypothetical protein